MTNVYKYLIESYNDKQSNSQSDNNELIYPPCDRLGLKRLVTTGTAMVVAGPVIAEIEGTGWVVVMPK